MTSCVVSEMSGMIEHMASVVYLDTNVFIKAVEGVDEASAPAKRLISILRQKRSGMAATSEITLAEVLASPKRSDFASFEYQASRIFRSSRLERVYFASALLAETF